MYAHFNINKIPRKYQKYKLCYIDEIPKTIYGPTPESEKIMNSPGYKSEDYCSEEYGWRRGRLGSLEYADLPNPDYIKGEQELYAYFTPLSVDEQWGDDWNDCPYEHNAEIPYDDTFEHVTDETGKETTIQHEHTIVVVPFALKSWNFNLPKDYSNQGNSHFSVDMINRGAVAWIYDYNYKNKKSVAIHGGDTVSEFVTKVQEIHQNNPEWEDYEDD